MKYFAIIPAFLGAATAHKGGKKSYGMWRPAAQAVHVAPLPTPCPEELPKPLLRAPLPAPAPFFAPEYECTAPVESCPEGFEQIGKQCEKALVSAPEMVCRMGELAGDMCLHTIGTLPSCPDGFDLRGDGCCKIITEPLIPVCPEGYSDIGDCCEKPVPAPVVEICPVGVRMGDSCVVTHRSAPQVSTFCAEGFEMEGGECCKIETYDCTPAGAEPLECGDDSEMCVNFRRHLGDCGRNPACIQKVRHELKERTKEIAVIAQTCQRKIVSPPLSSSFCASGELVGHMCVLEEHHAPVQKCTAEGGVDGCFSKLIADYEHICPAGFEMNGHICSTKIDQPTIPICPAGFDMGAGGCEKLTPAAPVCPVGMLGPDSLCHDKDFAPLTTTWCTTCTGSNCVVKPCM